MNNFNFKVQVVIPEHSVTVKEPVYEVIGYDEIHTKEIGFEIECVPRYGKQIGFREERVNLDEEVIATYEQIPLLYNDISFSCIKKDSDSEWFDDNNNSDYMPIQGFIERVNKCKMYKYDRNNLCIKYGFSYETSDGETISRYYFTEDLRNKEAESLGFNFTNLDWCDHMAKSDKLENQKINIKK
ncbi:MAG: hypothetical protein Q4E39_02040 [bacterium]|nr:hypothetical protein [bacterium]